MKYYHLSELYIEEEKLKKHLKNIYSLTLTPIQFQMRTVETKQLKDMVEVNLYYNDEDAKDSLDITPHPIMKDMAEIFKIDRDTIKYGSYYNDYFAFYIPFENRETTPDDLELAKSVVDSHMNKAKWYWVSIMMHSDKIHVSGYRRRLISSKETGGNIEAAKLKYAKEDIALLEKEGAMSITDTKHGILHGEYLDNAFEFTDSKGKSLFLGDKKEAIIFLTNAYTVEFQEGGVAGGLTKEKAEEVMRYLDAHKSEHKLVSKYKGVVSDRDISSIIESWATTIKPIDEAIKDHWALYSKIYKPRQHQKGGRVNQNNILELVYAAAQYTDANLEPIAGRQWNSFLDAAEHIKQDYIPKEDWQKWDETVLRIIDRYNVKYQEGGELPPGIAGFKHTLVKKSNLSSQDEKIIVTVRLFHISQSLLDKIRYSNYSWVVYTDLWDKNKKEPFGQQFHITDFDSFKEEEKALEGYKKAIDKSKGRIKSYSITGDIYKKYETEEQKQLHEYIPASEFVYAKGGQIKQGSKVWINDKSILWSATGKVVSIKDNIAKVEIDSLPINALIKDRHIGEIIEINIKDIQPMNTNTYATGGNIPDNYAGKTAEEVWNMWTLDQRTHFIRDHFDDLNKHGSSLGEKYTTWISASNYLVGKDYFELSKGVKQALNIHVNSGQYAQGGGIHEKEGPYYMVEDREGFEKLAKKRGFKDGADFEEQTGASFEDIKGKYFGLQMGWVVLHKDEAYKELFQKGEIKIDDEVTIIPGKDFNLGFNLINAVGRVVSLEGNIAKVRIESVHSIIKEKGLVGQIVEVNVSDLISLKAKGGDLPHQIREWGEEQVIKDEFSFSSSDYSVKYKGRLIYVRHLKINKFLGKHTWIVLWDSWKSFPDNHNQNWNSFKKEEDAISYFKEIQQKSKEMIKNYSITGEVAGVSKTKEQRLLHEYIPASEYAYAKGGNVYSHKDIERQIKEAGYPKDANVFIILEESLYGMGNIERTAYEIYKDLKQVPKMSKQLLALEDVKKFSIYVRKSPVAKWELYETKTKNYNNGGAINVNEEDYLFNAEGKKFIVNKVTVDKYLLESFGDKSPRSFDRKEIDSYLKNGKWRLVKEEAYAKGGGVYRKGGALQKCPIGTEIQTIILSKERFKNKMSARKWVRENELKYGKIDTKENTYRFRQQNPNAFTKNSFRTIELTNGVKAVIGCPKEKKMAHGGEIKKEIKGAIKYFLMEAQEYSEHAADRWIDENRERVIDLQANMTPSDIVREITFEKMAHGGDTSGIDWNILQWAETGGEYFAHGQKANYHLHKVNQEWILSIKDIATQKEGPRAKGTLKSMKAMAQDIESGKMLHGGEVISRSQAINDIFDYYQTNKKEIQDFSEWTDLDLEQEYRALYGKEVSVYNEGGRINDSLVEKMRTSAALLQKGLDNPLTPEKFKDAMRRQLGNLQKMISGWEGRHKTKIEEQIETAVTVSPETQEAEKEELLRQEVVSVPETIQSTQKALSIKERMQLAKEEFAKTGGFYIDVERSSRDKVRNALWYKKIKPLSETLPDKKTRLIVSSQEQLDIAYNLYVKFLTRANKEVPAKEAITGSYEKKMQEGGLIVTGSTQEDNQEIGKLVSASGFFGIWDARNGYWVFPEEEENYDELEKNIQKELDKRNISARFEGIFASMQKGGLARKKGWTEYTGFSEFEQAVAFNTHGDYDSKETDSKTWYYNKNGKLIGIWDNEEGEGSVKDAGNFAKGGPIGMEDYKWLLSYEIVGNYYSDQKFFERADRFIKDDTKNIEKRAGIIDKYDVAMGEPPDNLSAPEKIKKYLSDISRRKGGPVSKAKARKILHEVKAHGKPLSEQQRKFFGAIASGEKWSEYEVGGIIKNKKWATDWFDKVPPKFVIRSRRRGQKNFEARYKVDSLEEAIRTVQYFGRRGSAYWEFGTRYVEFEILKATGNDKYEIVKEFKDDDPLFTNPAILSGIILKGKESDVKKLDNYLKDPKRREEKNFFQATAYFDADSNKLLAEFFEPDSTRYPPTRQLAEEMGKKIEKTLGLKFDAIY